MIDWPSSIRHLVGSGARAPGPADIRALEEFKAALEAPQLDSTPTTIRSCLRRLAAHLKDRKRSIDEKRLMFDDYQRLLGSYSQQEWTDATDELLMYGQWFPALGDLRQQLSGARERRRIWTSRVTTLLYTARLSISARPSPEAPIRSASQAGSTDSTPIGQ